MGLAKEKLIEDMHNQEQESYECAGCSDMVQLNIEEYKNLAELQLHARQLEKQFALCEYCRSKYEID